MKSALYKMNDKLWQTNHQTVWLKDLFQYFKFTKSEIRYLLDNKYLIDGGMNSLGRLVFDISWKKCLSQFGDN